MGEDNVLRYSHVYRQDPGHIQIVDLGAVSDTATLIAANALTLHCHGFANHDDGLNTFRNIALYSNSTFSVWKGFNFSRHVDVSTLMLLASVVTIASPKSDICNAGHPKISARNRQPGASVVKKGTPCQTASCRAMFPPSLTDGDKNKSIRLKNSLTLARE